jgi:hypothetical protein
MGISAAVGVESVAAGVIRVFENKQHHEHEKDMAGHDSCCGCENGDISTRRNMDEP